MNRVNAPKSMAALAAGLACGIIAHILHDYMHATVDQGMMADAQALITYLLVMFAPHLDQPNGGNSQ